MLSSRRLLLALSSLFVAFMVGCGGGGHSKPPVVNVSLQSISIAPASVTVPLGLKQQFTATGTYSDGTTKDLTSSATWSVAPSGMATVAGGLATTVAAGSATITATSGSVNSTATLTITPPALTSITITPSSADLILGTTQDFIATGTLTNNTTTDLTSTAQWTSSNASIVSVLKSAGRIGRVVPRGVGQATIQVQSGPIKGGADIHVSALKARFAYVAEHSALSTYAVDDATGSLRPISNKSLPNSVSELVVDPTGKYVFAAEGNKIETFQVDDVTGELTTSTTITWNDYMPDSLVVHPSGKFLYVPVVATSSVYVFGIASGGLQLVAGYPQIRYDNIIFDPQGKFAYSLTQIPYRLRVDSVDQSTGALTYVGSATPGTQPIAMAIDPAGQFLYVANLWSHDISAFAIEVGTGQLKQLAGSPTPAGADNPTDLKIDPAGRFLYVLCNGSQKTVRTFAIADDGALTATDAIAIDSVDAYRIKIHPSGTHLYVADNSGYKLMSFDIDQVSGKLRRSGTMRTWLAPFDLDLSRGVKAVSVEPKSLFVANVGARSVSMFPIDSSTGELGTATTFPTSLDGTSIATDAKGKFLYVGNWWDNRVSGYNIDPNTSGISPLSGSPFTTGNTPSGLSFDPFQTHIFTASWDQLASFNFDSGTGILSNYSEQPATVSVQMVVTGAGGRYIYVVGAGSIAGFAANADGSASPLSWTPIPLTVPPSSYARGATIDGSGRFLYIAMMGYGNDSTTLLAYSIDASTGALTPLADAPFTTELNPICLTSDSLGRFLFVGHYGGVAAYSIDQTTGKLMLAGEYLNSGYVLSVWIDASNNFLYAGVGGAQQLMAYRINPLTGELTPLTGSPYATTNEPWAITGTRSIH
jgi:6-phosphogluconolactonase (cycloisomerase 2 family)